MKKVCVVTWYGGENYGTTLQAAALCRYLEKQGYEVSVLGVFKPKKYLMTHPGVLAGTVVNKVKYINRKRKAGKTGNAGQKTKKAERIAQFNRDNFNVLNISTDEKWNQVKKDGMIFVTGSDQIWNPNHYSGKCMLDFAYGTGLRKVAFSSSIGVGSIPLRYAGRYRKYLRDFDALSVREQSAADLLTNLLKRPVKKVVDPTQLLTAEDWDYFAEKAVVPKEVMDSSYILCYFVGEREGYWDYVKKMQEETGYKVVLLPMHQKDYQRQNCVIFDSASAYEFVRLIKQAQIVCTDSFHATAFSIAYQREIYILQRFKDSDAKSQNSRLYDVLGRYGMKERWIEDESKFIRCENIDYNRVLALVREDRIDSCAFLHRALEE